MIWTSISSPLDYKAKEICDYSNVVEIAHHGQEVGDEVEWKEEVPHGKRKTPSILQQYCNQVNLGSYLSPYSVQLLFDRLKGVHTSSEMKHLIIKTTWKGTDMQSAFS